MMYASDLSGFEPRYFNFENLINPSDPFRSAPLTMLLDEFPFWGIDSESRAPIYAAINGVVLYDNLGNPEEYRNFIASIGVEIEALAQFTRAMEERYVRLKSELDGRSIENPDVMAFLLTTEDFSEQIAGYCEEAEIPAWCGVFFAMGMYGAHTNTTLAADRLSKWQETTDYGVSYLYEYVRNSVHQFYFTHEANPMDRFLAYCYPNTPYEREFIIRRILAGVNVTIDTNHDTPSIAHIFMRSHDLAARIAREEPGTVQKLLVDIEQGIGPGAVQSKIDCFENVLGDTKTYPVSFTTLWEAGRELIEKQHPAIIPNLGGHAHRIAEISYFQRMLDFAIWSALAGSAPGAFKNFSMEPYNLLLASAPEKAGMN